MKSQPVEAYFFSKDKIELDEIYVNRSRHLDSPLKRDSEELFEQVRVEKCESLPTRIGAIFVSPSIEISLDWFQTIYVNEIRNESLDKCYVYKVQVIGDVKWFDGKYYNMLGQPFCISKKTPEELAKLYWDSVSDTPRYELEEEGLVMGSIKFLQEFCFTKNEYGDFVIQQTMERKEYEDKLQELSNKFWRIDMNSLAAKYNELCSCENLTKDERNKLDDYESIIERWNKEVYDLINWYSELKKDGIQNIVDPSKYLFIPNR